MSTRLSLATAAILVASAAQAEQAAVAPNPLIAPPIFKPAQAESASPSALTTRTGTVVVTISGGIASNSPPPATRKLYCLVQISGSGSLRRTGITHAVISGNSFSCTTRLAYKWLVDPAYGLTTYGAVVGVDTSLSPSEAMQTFGFALGFNNIVNVEFPTTTPFPPSGATTTKTATGIVF